MHFPHAVRCRRAGSRTALRNAAHAGQRVLDLVRETEQDLQLAKTIGLARASALALVAQVVQRRQRADLAAVVVDEQRRREHGQGAMANGVQATRRRARYRTPESVRRLQQVEQPGIAAEALLALSRPARRPEARWLGGALRS